MSDTLSPISLGRIRTFVQTNKKTIKTHTTAWSIYFFVEFCFGYGLNILPGGFLNFIKNVFFGICFFYAFLFGALIPLLPQKKVQIVIRFMLLLLLTIFLKYLTNRYILGVPQAILFEKGILNYVLFDTYKFATTTFYAIAYWIYLESIKEKNLRIKAEIELRKTQEELLKTEIKFLKAQVNPHFLFNTLNFFYAESYKLSPKLGEGIMTLTEIMRYTVQSTQNEEIPVEKEAEFLHKYVEIQQLRFHNQLQVCLETNIFSPNQLIPPLIILTFVENAFKYGKLNDPNKPLIIKLEAEPTEIRFFCQNLKNTHFQEPSTSVGIENIKIRLNKHCDDYDLSVTDENNLYTVNLQINFK
ncbi:MAG: sensor histidine kinase [Emticicia sp.]